MIVSKDEAKFSLAMCLHIVMLKRNQKGFLHGHVIPRGLGVTE